MYAGPRGKAIGLGYGRGSGNAGRTGVSPVLRTDTRSRRVPWRYVPSLEPRTEARAAGGFGGAGDRGRSLGFSLHCGHGVDVVEDDQHASVVMTVIGFGKLYPIPNPAASRFSPAAPSGGRACN